MKKFLLSNAFYWVTAACIALWILYGIPTVIGIVLIILRIHLDKKIKKKEALCRTEENALEEIKTKKQKEIDEKTLELSELIETKNKQINELNSELCDKESLLQKLKEQAKTDAAKEMAEINEVLPGLYAELAGVKDELEKSNKALFLNSAKIQRLQMQAKAMQAMLKKAGDDPIYISAHVVDETDEVLAATVELRLHYMDVRQLKTLFTQNKKVIEDTLKRYESRYSTKALATLYKLMVLALEAELQNILFGLRFGKLEDAFKEVRAMTMKYQQIASDGNQTIAPTIAKFISEIDYLYMEAVKIEYEYYTKKEAIKEEQRVLREQMRQEAEDRKRMEQELKRIEAEEEKFKNEMGTLSSQLTATTDEVSAKAIQDRLNELQEQLENVANKKEDIARLQHGKAGYVYIISNLGSFGDNVFKIGMTRRLEPQERIDELGSASVPFPFDVHSMIFSDDAVDLENNLHKSLHANRVNKVNLHKEFFKTNLDELEKMVYAYQPTAEFKRTMLAEQYNQSLSIGNDDIPIELVETADDTSDDDSDEESLG